MSTIIKAADIHKSYQMGRETLKVLKGVSVEIRAGSFTAITGASGSGKSTLLHILGALDKADNGHVEFEGRSLSQMSSGRLNDYRNRSVGFVFQFYHLLNELNVLENTLLPAMAGRNTLGWIRSKTEMRKRANDILNQLGLSDRIRHRPFELSGGERQRVAIARALINCPKLLLADEPTGNLDSVTGSGILDVLKQLNRDGQTVIMVTHDDRIAARAERVFRLEDGKIKPE